MSSELRDRREQLAGQRAEAPTSRGLALGARPTRNDVGFSLLVGALLVMSPLTGGTRLLPSLTLGAVGAAVVLLVRLKWPGAREAALPRFTFARPSPVAAALLALVALAFAPTLAWMYERYTDGIWQNAHGLFVPLFMVLLSRHVLRRDPSPQEESSAWGFAFLLPGLALAVFDAGVGSHYLASIGLVLVVPGLSLLLLGARRTRAIAMPLALGVFLIPLPTSLERFVWLSEATAEVARHVLHALDYQVAFTQTFARLDRERWVSISHNCSGAATMYAGIAFAAIAAVTGRSRTRRWLPLLVLYPTLVLANGLRCVFMILLVWYRGIGALHSPLHGLSGIATFVAVLIVLWLCSDRRGMREALS